MASSQTVSQRRDINRAQARKAGAYIGGAFQLVATCFGRATAVSS